MQLRYIDKPSKNYEDTEIKPEWIIIHCIGYDEKKALGILTGEEPEIEASAHYFLPQRNVEQIAHLHDKPIDYPVYQLVPVCKKAYHAGASRWKKLEMFNDFSIGIEFSSPNYAYAVKKPDQLNWYHFEEFHPQQIEAGMILIKELIKRHNINPANILTHADISAWRLVDNKPQATKTDPGSYFPMQRLAENGIGVWPTFERTRSTELDMSVKNVQNLLKEVGYNLDETGELDVPTISSIRAFKIHYMPEEYKDDNVSDAINTKMVVGLENLIDGEYKYKITELPLGHSKKF